VREALRRLDICGYSDKVGEVQIPFTEFLTDRPLRKLAEKQVELAKKVVERDLLDGCNRIAGVDAAYRGETAYAACVVVDRFGSVVSEASAKAEVGFPYIPGYFYWREGPVLASVIRGVDFDVLMVNAHGKAHPRLLGLASHLGLELNRPTIGVSAHLLAGEVRRGGEASEVYLLGERVGIIIEGKPPLVVSVGHMVCLDTAVSIVRCFRDTSGLPWPLAAAHLSAVKLRGLSKLRDSALIQGF